MALQLHSQEPAYRAALLELAALVDTTIDKGLSADPHTIAVHVMNQASDSLLLEAMKERLLADFVRERVRIRRNQPSYVQQKDEGAWARTVVGTDPGQRPPTRTPSAFNPRFQAAKQHADKGSLQYFVPGRGKHQTPWMYLRDMTAADCEAVASERQKIAAGALSVANRFRKLASAMTTNGARVVADLDDDIFTRVWEGGDAE